MAPVIGQLPDSADRAQQRTSRAQPPYAVPTGRNNREGLLRRALRRSLRRNGRTLRAGALAWHQVEANSVQPQSPAHFHLAAQANPRHGFARPRRRTHQRLKIIDDIMQGIPLGKIAHFTISFHIDGKLRHESRTPGNPKFAPTSSMFMLAKSIAWGWSCAPSVSPAPPSRSAWPTWSIISSASPGLRAVLRPLEKEMTPKQWLEQTSRIQG